MKKFREGHLVIAGDNKFEKVDNFKHLVVAIDEDNQHNFNEKFRCFNNTSMTK